MSVCFKSVIQSGHSLFLSKIKNTSLKLTVGVSPLQLVNLHRNRRYFVMKLHTWFCLSYFLKTNKILLHLSIFYEYQQFFQHRIHFAIQPPVTHFSTFYHFFLIMLFNNGSNIICITCVWSKLSLILFKLNVASEQHIWRRVLN